MTTHRQAYDLGQQDAIAAADPGSENPEVPQPYPAATFTAEPGATIEELLESYSAGWRQGEEDVRSTA